jgi:hypothetical protein
MAFAETACRVLPTKSAPPISRRSGLSPQPSEEIARVAPIIQINSQCFQALEEGGYNERIISRADVISRRLILNDAIEIWRRRSSGEAQHKIAAVFEVNQGRISEILTGKRFPAAKRLAQSAQRDLGLAQG